MKSQSHFILVTPKGTEIPIEAQFSNTVFDIKKRVEKSEGISISDQILIFNGLMLEDNKQIQSYKILQGSTIKLSLQSETMVVLSFKSLIPEMMFTLKCNVMDKVFQLKKQIQEEKLNPEDGLSLYFQDEEMSDTKKLSDYGVYEEAAIKMVVKWKIFVRFRMKKIPIEVNPYDSVEAMKRVLQNLNEQLHIDLPEPESYVFLYKQKPMGDEHTVRSYGVQPEDMIGMFEGSIESFTKVGMVNPRKKPDDPCFRFLLAIRLILQYIAEGLGCSSETKREFSGIQFEISELF